MATMQRMAGAAHYSPASKLHIILRFAAYRAMSSIGGCFERMGGLPVLLEIRLRAAGYRLQQPFQHVVMHGRAIRRVALAVVAGAAAIVFLRAPLESAYRYMKDAYGKAEWAPSLSLISSAGLAQGVDYAQIAEIEDSVLPLAGEAPLPFASAEAAGTEYATEAEPESVPVEQVEHAGAGLMAGGVHISDKYTVERLTDIPAVTYAWPTEGVISSGFGRRSIPIGSSNHKGLDIGGVSNQIIYAAAPGKVVFAGWEESYGNMIRILHENGDETIYGHCSSLLVKNGAVVKQGQRIAKMGSTGVSSGVHLHFELRINGKAVDPELYLPATSTN